MLQSSAALKELGLVDTGVVMREDVVQLRRSFARSVAIYSCRKVGGDRSHAGPRPSMNSSSDVKVTDLTIYGDSSVWFRQAASCPAVQFNTELFTQCQTELRLCCISY
jgi:hypothetical protein